MTAGNPVMNMGRLTGCKVTERNVTNRPVSYLLTDDRGRLFKIQGRRAARRVQRGPALRYHLRYACEQAAS